MNIVGIIIISVMGLFAVIGLVAGAIKGFTRSKSWAVELVLTGVVAIPISKAVSGNDGGVTPAIVSVALTVALVCLFMSLFALSRKFINGKIEKRKQLSFYEQYDEREDNTEQILSAIGTEDKKQYKKLAKRKFKEKRGGWGVVDRIIGSLSLALKGAVIAGFIAVFILTVLDFTRLASFEGKLYGSIGTIYENGIWKFFKNYIFDFILIGTVMMCVKSGFQGGLFSSLWALAVIGMVAGAGVLSWHLSFNVGEFVSVAEGLEGKLANSLSGISGVLDTVGISTLTIAKIIILAIIFVLLLVAVILIAIFVPKLIYKARDGVAFRTVDGVLGAIVLTVFVLGILLVVGAVANSLYEFKFMNVFNAYFEKSGVATYLYDKNLLNAMGLLNNLPIKGWLTP